jgi:hypothetical protein
MLSKLSLLKVYRPSSVRLIDATVVNGMAIGITRPPV